MKSLHKALAKEQEYHAITKKAHNALKKKYCDLDEKHKELELQYNILWDSNSHPSKAKDASTTSTSQGCGKCYNVDLNAYSTNHHKGKGFLWQKFSSQKLGFCHKLTFVVTFKIATSHHKYSPHKYSSDDFLFPTNGCTH